MSARILHWLHTVRFACHPGIYRMVSLSKRSFSWPSLERDAREYVVACEVCARSKSRHQAPSGLLHPLPAPVTCGRTSLWTSSQGCRVPLVTRSSLPSWIDSPRLPILFPCLNSLPPLRLLAYSVFMFFGCMGFPRTLCLTGDLSLCHVCGRGFVLPWGWGRASPRAITHSLIDKLKGRTNNWNPRSVVWFWLILLPGALISPG